MSNTHQITLDERQLKISRDLFSVADSLNSRSFVTSLFNKLFSRKLSKGLYFYGGVGIGKTMLMNEFYLKIKKPKEIIHFQKFMSDLHKQIHNAKNSIDGNKIVKTIAKQIAQRSSVICIDEFEVKDISDAMIIMRLFRFLSNLDVYIMVTTNVAVEDMYKDGIQRESFLPFINNIKQTFQVIHLQTDVDYRYNNLKLEKERILFPASKITNSKINQIKASLCKDRTIASYSIKLMGRELKFSKVQQNILFTNFTEMFERNIGYNDYVTIAEEFKIIVLEDVRIISEDENNIATRFINFIDNAYFNNVLLFVEIECDLCQLYIKGSKIQEFKRTISRLNEMNSLSYPKQKN